MHTDEDLDSAVKAGVLEAQAVSDFRRHIEKRRHTSRVDEENFRLLSGFHDIFVIVAALIFMISAAGVSELLTLTSTSLQPFTGLILIAVSWWLSTYFVKKKRLALPAIVFLTSYVVGVVMAVTFAAELFHIDSAVNMHLVYFSLVVMVYLHWRSFRVPITIGASVACTAFYVIVMLRGFFPTLEEYDHALLALAGVLLFLVAMYWDARDTQRITYQSDVAFWLHLMAAPMIVHPVFSSLSQHPDGMNLMDVALIVSLYIALCVVSLVIDRRALMVSAISYVLFALTRLIENVSDVNADMAFGGLILGSILLYFCIAWHRSRAALVNVLPHGVRRYIPAV